MTNGHTLALEPQPIADQWMGRCNCGWTTTASFYEFPDRETVISVINTRHAQHCGANARASCVSQFRNPYYLPEAMPAATGETVIDWQAKAEAWLLGWQVEDAMR